MNLQPLVSVIIPLYNAERYIAETIDSVISQTYNNFEIIIIDDCSTDNSREIVRQYEKKYQRVVLIESKINFGGPAKPRNVGIKNAKGVFVAFLDADDIWENTKLECQIKLMIQNNYDFTSTAISKIDNHSCNLNDNILTKLFRGVISKKGICDLIKYSFIANSSVVIRKNSIGSFSEKKSVVAVEDFQLWLKILNRDDIKFYFINEKLLKYRILKNSISERGLSDKQHIKKNLCVLSHIMKYKRYDLVTCFYFKIIKDFVKRILS